MQAQRKKKVKRKNEERKDTIYIVEVMFLLQLQCNRATSNSLFTQVPVFAWLYLFKPRSQQVAKPTVKRLNFEKTPGIGIKLNILNNIVRVKLQETSIKQT